MSVYGAILLASILGSLAAATLPSQTPKTSSHQVEQSTDAPDTAHTLVTTKTDDFSPSDSSVASF